MSGLTKNGASSQLVRWLKTGWVEKVALGQYRRTAKFGATEAAEETPATRVKVPGLDAPEQTVQQQLEAALKERDRARGNGQERLAKILQDKVDKLQAQLGK